MIERSVSDRSLVARSSILDPAYLVNHRYCRTLYPELWEAVSAWKRAPHHDRVISRSSRRALGFQIRQNIHGLRCIFHIMVGCVWTHFLWRQEKLVLEGLKIITLLSIMIVMMEFTLKIMEYGIGVIIIGEIQLPFQKN